MSRLTAYEEPELVKGDEYRPIDHVGSHLVVKVKQLKDSVVTQNSPDGAPGIVVDLVDLETDKDYHDVLWMGGAMVDGLKRYVGKLVVIGLEKRKSASSGRPYPAPVTAGPDQVKRGEDWLATHKDPFAPTLGTVADNDKPPF